MATNRLDGMSMAGVAADPYGPGANGASYPGAAGAGAPSWLGPAIGGVATLGGALLANRGGSSSNFQGSPLPFTQEMSGTMADYGSLINQYKTMSADPRSLGMAANLSNRQAALRGIQGPLAVGMANSAQSGVLRDFEAQRGQHLMSLMNARATLGQQLQLAEQQRRKEMWEHMQGKAAASDARNRAIGSGIGTAGGAVLGSVIPGIGTVVGGAAGGVLGGLVGGLF